MKQCLGTGDDKEVVYSDEAACGVVAGQRRFEMETDGWARENPLSSATAAVVSGRLLR